MKYRIRFEWDSEAAVWIATSKDVPGLVLESCSFDTIPELIVLNGNKLNGDNKR